MQDKNLHCFTFSFFFLLSSCARQNGLPLRNIKKRIKSKCYDLVSRSRIGVKNNMYMSAFFPDRSSKKTT